MHLPRSGSQAQSFESNPSGSDKTAPRGSDAEPVSYEDLDFAALGQVWQADMFEIVEEASQSEGLHLVHDFLFFWFAGCQHDQKVVACCTKSYIQIDLWLVSLTKLM